MNTIYSLYVLIMCIISIGSQAIKMYEPEPQKISLAEYERIEALKNDFRAKEDNLYLEADKIESEAEYEVTEAFTESEEVGVEEYYEPVATETDAQSSDMTYLGGYELTAYCWTGDPCKDGVYPQLNYTAACNDPALWHRWIYIEGYGTYYVHDIGGMPTYNIIDVYLGDYDSCIQFGRQSANVYLIE